MHTRRSLAENLKQTKTKLAIALKYKNRKLSLKQEAVREEKEERELGKRKETDRMEKEARVKAGNEKRLKERVDLALHLYDDIKRRAGMFDQKYNFL